MNADIWAGIQVYKGGDSLLLGCRILLEHCITTVCKPQNKLAAPLYNKVKVRHESFEDHDSFQLLADNHVPVDRVITEKVPNINKTERRIIKVGIGENQKNSSVNELAQKDQGHHIGDLVVDLRMAYLGYQVSAHYSKADVDAHD